MADFHDPFYLLAVAAFVVALIRMGTPRTAKSGILWAGLAMLLAIAVTFTFPGLSNLPLILLGIAVGSSIGWFAAVKVAMADMPQMVAIYNGMGAGAASAIASVEILKSSLPFLNISLALAGSAIGSISIAGSIVAFLKLQGWMPQKPLVFRGQQPVNLAVLSGGAAAGLAFVYFRDGTFILTSLAVVFVILTVLYGFMMALPIGGADMPVIIALFNALTGLAVSLDGFSLPNYAMIVGGLLVGAAGTMLTIAMAKGMNRSLYRVVFEQFVSTSTENNAAKGTLREISVTDAAVMLAYSQRAVIIPGFGMAASQAQFKIKELMDVLLARGLTVTFAIHPVAGRMPGHMNVLLAEANVPYDLMVDLEEANRDMESVDVALVVGANDVVNPAARREDSVLHGMPILNADKAKNAIVLKRGSGKGFSGITNELFESPGTRMLYGDATESIAHLIQEVKKL